MNYAGQTCRVALLTMANPDGFFTYDHLLEAPLVERGWQAEHVPWDRADVDWARYDAVVIRSTWDYQQHPEKFERTLAYIEAKTRLFNPLEVCRWNMDKRYLLQLAQQGVPVIPTRLALLLNQERIQQLRLEFELTGESQVLVVKPLVGANADDVHCLTADPASWEGALATFGQQPCLAQPFLDSIREEGEYSLFYFGGEYSHAILKLPAAGDFRVQEEHGGRIAAVTPDIATQNLGRQILDRVPETLLYARVDLARLADGQLALMEMELIEPSLYFPYDSASPARFCGALIDMLNS